MTSRMLFLVAQTVLLVVIPTAWSSADDVTDPIRMWERLSPEQQAAVQETLSQQLPKVLPEEANEYAQTLAAEVSRWSKLAHDLEQGNYGGMIEAFQGELTGFVRQYIDDRLPKEGFTRWLFEQADADANLIRKVVIDIADPNKQWEDVKATLFGEVNEKIQATSQETLKNVVVDAINEVIGTAGIEGYSPGELYILAVGEWTDYVKKWPELFEQEAANELYEIYRKNRQQYGRESAQTTVKDLWVLERVPGRDDQARRIRSWSARLTHLSDKLNVRFEDLPDMLLALFDQYWSTARGQDPWTESWDTGFHGWLTERIKAEVRDAQQELRRQARGDFERARSESQRKLAEIHRLAARELQKAIEQQLTDQQRAARDAAIQEAMVLVDLMWQRNVQPGQQECAEYATLSQALEAIAARASSAQGIFQNGSSDEVESIKQRIDGLGAFVNKFESGLGVIRAKILEAEALVAAVEDAASRVCQSAGLVSAVRSKDEARERMISAAKESKTVERMSDKALEHVFQCAMLRGRLIEGLQGVDTRDLEDLRRIRAELHEIDLAIRALGEYEELRNRWDGLMARLSASEKRQQVILGAFAAKDARIQILLGAHQADTRIAKIRAEVGDYRTKMACVAANVQDWNRHWAEAVFPAVAAPSAEELRQVRNLLASYPHLFQLAVEEFESLRVGVERLEQQTDQFYDRLREARLRANLCAAQGIVNYDRAWVKSDLIRLADPDVAREPDQPPDYGADIQDAREPVARKPDVPPDYGADIQDARPPVARKPDVPPDYGADIQDARQPVTRPPVAQEPVAQEPVAQEPVTREPRQPSGVGAGPQRVPESVAPGGEPTATPPARDVVIGEPLYAVYGIHAWQVPALPANIQQMVGTRNFQLDEYAAAATAWINGLGVKDVAPAEHPASFLAFRVSGDVLADYTRHVNAGSTGEDRPDYWLFQQGGLYHQVITISAPQNLSFQAPLFLSFQALFTGEPPARFRQTEFSLLGAPVRFQQALSLSERRTCGGGWSIQDQNRVTYTAGPLEYDQVGQWKETTYRQALDHARKVLHTGIQAAIGLGR